MKPIQTVSRNFDDSQIIQSKMINRRLSSYHNYENGWCKSKDFNSTMQKEIRRSYRTGAPLSYVVVKLVPTQHRKLHKTSSRYNRFLKDFTKLISDNSREFDIKCFNSFQEISLLLIDTTLEGTKIYTNKIAQEIQRYFSTRKNEEAGEYLESVQFSMYPLNRISGTKASVAKPIIITTVKNQKKVTDESKIDITEKLEIDWNEVVSNKYKIPLPETIAKVNHGKNQENFTYLFIKRLLDIVGSILGIFLFFPLILIIGIGVKLSSPGPILFKQKRIGYLGKTFTFLKFRSMRIHSDEDIHKDYVQKLIQGKHDEINMGTKDNPTYKIIGDPRITKFGGFLRKTSLDELPQFFNVLSGQMSLVGPRPPIPYEVEIYKSWHLRRILEVKPGLTGMWQVFGRSTTTFDEMVRMDLQYVSKMSILMDLKLIFKTITVVFKSEGAM